MRSYGLNLVPNPIGNLRQATHVQLTLSAWVADRSSLAPLDNVSEP
jgi:16S rRNA C1402 (ribose-2'-O) methylase RsmI